MTLHHTHRALLTVVLWFTLAAAGFAQASTPPEPLDPLLQEAIAHAPTAEQSPDSDYAILLHLGKFTVDDTGLPVMEMRLVRKIFNKHAKEIGVMTQRYDDRNMAVTVVRARTIQRDGAIDIAGPDAVKTTKRKPDESDKTWTHEIRATMPFVNAGSILDVTWQFRIVRAQIPGHFEVDSWEFSDREAPVYLSRLTVEVPRDRKLHYRVYNDTAQDPVVADSPDGKKQTYIWERRNLPAIQPVEPSMPDFEELGVWMDVSTISDYQTIATAFGNLFTASMTPSDDIRKTVEKVAGSKKSAVEKARALYEWVYKNIRYDINETGKEDFGPDRAADILKRKSGDCKDQSVVLAALLEVAGIPASPALVPHAEHRRPSRQLPIITNFDHCIVQAEVDGQKVWLDPTTQEDYGILPMSLGGKEALVIRKGVAVFEEFPNPVRSLRVARDITYRDDGERSEKIEVVAQNDFPAPVRRFAASASGKLLMNPNIVLWENSHIDGAAKVKEENGVITFQLKAKVKDNVVRESDRVRTSVMLDSFIDKPETRRKWPYVYREESITTLHTVIHAPKGYTIGTVPESVNVTHLLTSYSRTMEKSADGRSLTITIVYHNRRGSLAVSELNPAQEEAYLKALPPNRLNLTFLREP